ncbi:MAG TPA: glycerophosphodiester phosphodiesterase family protein [Anaerolineales bacterium]|nr:glycerophosphodiester phosphodiesterase family protein [Anaerolineales bacterium]
MGFQTRSPLIFAHRGASAFAPENTLAAFETAIQQKADLIEVDAKLTADHHVVVIHDQTVDRTTDGSGRVADLPLAALRELNAGYNFRDQHPHETIPTLAEVFEVCAGRIRINIELKNFATPFDRLPEEVSRIIDYYQLHSEIIVSSFHPIPLRRFRDLSPEIPIGFLAKRGLPGFLSRSWLGRAIVPFDALHPEKGDISPSLMSKARRFGYHIHTFTVNDPVEMAYLITLGVNGLITDDPQLARQVIASNQ